jgi:hypothetical protein
MTRGHTLPADSKPINRIGRKYTPSLDRERPAPDFALPWRAVAEATLATASL